MGLRSALAKWLADELGGSATISEMSLMTGGASRQSWRLNLGVEGGAAAGEYRLVLRRDLHSEMQPDALTRQQEFRLLEIAHRGGVLVPRPRWSGELTDPDDGSIRPFFLMDWVAGETIGARVVRLPELAAARERLPAQMAEQLARIHLLSGEPDWLPGPANGQSPAEWSIGRLRKLAAEVEIVNPAYELAFRWLEANLPRPARTTLVHGDFRIGNMIVGPSGLQAVIDWEFAHRGDPAEDLAWPCLRDWRFGSDALNFGGVGQPEQFLDAYQAAGGEPVDPVAIAYWEILGNLRWAVGCLSQARRHLGGQDPSIELASLGRRAAEMELEFLRLIEQANGEPGGGPSHSVSGTAPAAELDSQEARSGSRSAELDSQPVKSGSRSARLSTQDPPSWQQLLAAVSRHLQDELIPALDDPGRRYRSLIAANLLEIVQREHRLGPQQAQQEHRRLEALLGLERSSDSLEQLTQRLHQQVSVGEFDQPPQWTQLMAHLKASAVERLRIANPRFLARLEAEDPELAG